MTGLDTENTTCTLPRSALSAGQRQEMFDLLTRHFEGPTSAQFDRDLDEKDRVILLYRGSRLVGFSTLLAYESLFENRSLTVIYSGDTIVAPEAWRSTQLARAWIACVRQLRDTHPQRTCYWLLLTSGFRTYRFLPVFWREFHPRFDARTPDANKRLLVHLARGRFGDQYRQEHGIVRFARPQRLCKDLGAVAAGRLADPHVAFFLSANPGHGNGDELVCVTELSDHNLTAAGRRMAFQPSQFRPPRMSSPVVPR